jgi:hypothetical protein
MWYVLGLSISYAAVPSSLVYLTWDVAGMQQRLFALAVDRALTHS